MCDFDESSSGFELSYSACGHTNYDPWQTSHEYEGIAPVHSLSLPTSAYVEAGNSYQRFPPECGHINESSVESLIHDSGITEYLDEVPPRHGFSTFESTSLLEHHTIASEIPVVLAGHVPTVPRLTYEEGSIIGSNGNEIVAAAYEIPVESHNLQSSISQPGGLKTMATGTAPKPRISSVTQASTMAGSLTHRRDLSLRVTKNKSQKPNSTQHRACWRCKRYKKSCVGNGETCDTCITSGFRIWPSALGCRRGNLEAFMSIILPASATKVLKQMNVAYPKPPSWRQESRFYQSKKVITVPDPTGKGDIWERLAIKVQSTEIYGPGILELIDIAARTQRRKDKPDKFLTLVAQATSMVIDLYREAISIGDGELFDPASEFSSLFSKTRKSSLVALDAFLRMCLTGRLKDWFSTFVGGIILVFSYILLSDIAAAIPAHIRDIIWPNLRKSVVDLRQYLYSTAQDLLSVLAKGAQMLDLDCWHSSPSSDGESVATRNRVGMRMMDDDEITYDAMQELQKWTDDFAVYLQEDCWMTTLPFTTGYLPIRSFARLFHFPNRA